MVPFTNKNESQRANLAERQLKVLGVRGQSPFTTLSYFKCVHRYSFLHIIHSLVLNPCVLGYVTESVPQSVPFDISSAQSTVSLGVLTGTQVLQPLSFLPPGDSSRIPPWTAHRFLGTVDAVEEDGT